MCMSVEDAANRLGHEYPGGAMALAARMGMSGNVLNQKLNPNREHHKLTLTEALRMQQLAGRADILHAMAATLGYMALPLPEVAEPQEIAHGVARLCAEFGDYLRAVDETWADRRISPNEQRRLERELGDMIAQAARLQAALLKAGAGQ